MTAQKKKVQDSMYYLEGFNTEIAVFITFIKYSETYIGTERKQFPPFPDQEGSSSQRTWKVGTSEM